MQPLLGTLGALAALGMGGAAYAVAGSPAGPAVAGPAPAAVVQSATGGPGPAAGSASATRPRVRALLRRTDHASIEVKVHGQWVTYDLDRGSVSAVSPASITLARPDGQSVTFSIGPSTRFRGVDSEAAIQVHQPALVISENGAALVIRQRPSGSGAGGAGAGAAAGGASTAA